MLRRFLSVFTALALASCSSYSLPEGRPQPGGATRSYFPGAEYLNRNPAKLQDHELALAFYAEWRAQNRRHAAILAGELQKKEVVSRSEFQRALTGTVEVGMSKNGVLASWGPSSDVNRSAGINFYAERWTYRSRGSHPRVKYVYFNSAGKVTGWQD